MKPGYVWVNDGLGVDHLAPDRTAFERFRKAQEYEAPCKTKLADIRVIRPLGARDGRARCPVCCEQAAHVSGRRRA